MAASLISRRLFLKSVPPALTVGAIIAAPPVVEAATSNTAPSKAWTELIATMAGIVPEGARVQVFGNKNGCRVEFMQTFMEPVHPKLPGQTMPVDWITGSFLLTDEGWEDEGRWFGRREDRP